MIHQMNLVIVHAFVNHIPIMANYVHNAVLKTLQDKGTPGFVGPAYHQASHMVLSYWIGYWDVTDPSSSSG